MAKLTSAIDILNEINKNQKDMKDVLMDQLKLDKQQEEAARRKETAEDKGDKKNKTMLQKVGAGIGKKGKKIASAGGGSFIDAFKTLGAFGLLALLSDPKVIENAKTAITKLSESMEGIGQWWEDMKTAFTKEYWTNILDEGWSSTTNTVYNTAVGISAGVTEFFNRIKKAIARLTPDWLKPKAPEFDPNKFTNNYGKGPRGDKPTTNPRRPYNPNDFSKNYGKGPAGDKPTVTRKPFNPNDFSKNYGKGLAGDKPTMKLKYVPTPKGNPVRNVPAPVTKPPRAPYISSTIRNAMSQTDNITPRVSSIKPPASPLSNVADSVKPGLFDAKPQNAAIMKRLGQLGKILKPIGIALDLAAAGMIVSDDNLNNKQKAEQLAGLVGANMGAIVGAKLGAVVGSMFPMVGTAIGAIGGGILGAYGGDEAAEFIMRQILTGQKPSKEEMAALNAKLQERKLNTAQKSVAANQTRVEEIERAIYNASLNKQSPVAIAAMSKQLETARANLKQSKVALGNQSLYKVQSEATDLTPTWDEQSNIVEAVAKGVALGMQGVGGMGATVVNNNTTVSNSTAIRTTTNTKDL